MVGVLLSLVIAGASPEPPKTIKHVYSSPFCTALRENIGNAVKGLIQNDIAFGQAKLLFLTMAHDKVFRANPSVALDMDVQRLGPYIGQIAQSILAAQKQLDDAFRFPAQPRTADERELDQMQSQLRAIAENQNQALNILSGTYYSYNGNRLLGRGDGLAAKDAGGPVDPAEDEKIETPVVLPPIRSTPATPATGLAPTAASKPTEMVDLGLAGFTKFAGLFNNLTTFQVRESVLEDRATKTILQAADQCNGSQG